MTYNFDPDLWYENQRALIEERRRSGDLGPEAYADALEDLDRRLDEMVARLDGTYRIPDRDRRDPTSSGT